MPRLTVEVDEHVYAAAQKRAMWERRGLREQLAVDLRGVYGGDRSAGPATPPTGAVPDRRKTERGRREATP